MLRGAFLLLALVASTSGSAADPLPGAPPMPDSVRTAITARLAKRPPGSQPRTRHLDGNGHPLYTNRLILESSPYLLQHAHNPVDWHPWGPEAFAEAQRLGRPVFLSVGYSTCHWCHVMERESFEDLEVARVLNELYVPIKVDREERPDVDASYMAAVQLMTREPGGWPMTVWLTPDGHPFDGATYLPPRDGDRGVSKGLLTRLRRAREIWDRNRDRVEESGADIAQRVRRALASAGDDTAVAGDLPGTDRTDRVVALYRGRFDESFGGLLPAPKFPGQLSIRLLLRHALRSGDERSQDIALVTLEAMAAGGLRDQLGGGFHRYATDRRWRVPHFEKMLYDNARLAIAYVEAARATGRTDLAEVAVDTLRYLDREMSAPGGGFYSATDADSPAPDGEPEEGRFFTWTADEVSDRLAPADASLVAAAFGLDDEAELDGRHVLYRERSVADLAQRLDRPEAEVRSRLGSAREALREARARRPPPALDDKVLTSWNALAVSAYARAGLALGNPELVDRAAAGARFLLSHLRDENGGLLRVWRSGAGSQPAFLEDHAFLEAALLDLFEATAESLWIREAVAEQAALDLRFAAPGGGYYRTPEDGEVVLARERPFIDDALPSGNAVALQNLLRLEALTTDDAYRRRAEALLRAAAPLLDRSPIVSPELLVAVEMREADPREIVLVAPSDRGELEPLLAVVRERYLPHAVLVAGTEKQLAGSAQLAPILDGKVARGGRATAYVCRRGVCRLPVTDPAAFAEQLDGRAAGGTTTGN
ncbi:MAG: thioredoxin domain-containing protein [Thermoanaerobaculia bacterium]